MVVLVIPKNEEDPIKNKVARVATTSDAAQIVLISVNINLQLLA